MGSEDQKAPASGRLLSLDALRGFDMFWIVGGITVVRSLLKHTDNDFLLALRSQLEHVEWEGFHFCDFIFPLFLFMIGVAMPLSFGKRLERGESKTRLYLHIIRRVAILIVLGMMVNGNLLSYDVSKFQITYSVLQVLALGYLVASIILLSLSLPWQIAATGGLLALYWALMTFVPVPGHVVGVVRPGANFGDWLNDLILGDFQGRWRFGWILCIMTFGSTAMLGVFAGQLLRSRKSHKAKVIWLVGLGIGCLIGGLVWGIWFPIIKVRWTSSYVLFAGGWSYLLLALFYLIIDVWGYRRWAFGFIVIGANPIFAYMAWQLLRSAFRQAATVFVAGLKQYVDPYYDSLAWLGAFLILWLILYWMYRTRTLIRV